MSEKILLAVIGILVSAIIAVGLFWHPEDTPPKAALNPLPAGGDFVLQSANGPVALTDFRGKLSLLYFGYTYCPDICPTTLSTLSAGLAELTPAEREQVSVLFISVDPERDTVSHLQTYVQFFDPSIRGMTGSAEQIAEIAARYGVFYQKQVAESAGDGYVVDHSSDTFIVGRDGRVKARMAHGIAPAQVAALIRQYLNQP